MSDFVNETITQIASDQPLSEVLTTLCRAVENVAAGVHCSILLLDENGINLRPGAAPSLPDSFLQATDGLVIGPQCGSCGTAAYRGEQVICADIEHDPLWADYKDWIIQNYNLRAGWSTPIRDSTGKVLGTFAMYASQPRKPTSQELDIVKSATSVACIAIERSRMSEKLRRAITEMENAHQIRRNFFSTVEHELRTPLHAIIGYADLLKEDLTDKNLTELLPDVRRIHGAGEKLLGLVNQMIEVAHLESGASHLVIEEFDLSDLIISVVTSKQEAFTQKHNQIETRFSGNSVVMSSDTEKVSYIIDCLVDNANKFTSNGKIVVETTAVPGHDFVEVKVSDSGIGMNSEQVARIFDYFIQADDGMSRRFEGTGLSLALSARFCKKLRGEIEIQSTPGKGSTFVVKLPRTL